MSQDQQPPKTKAPSSPERDKQTPSVPDPLKPKEQYLAPTHEQVTRAMRQHNRLRNMGRASGRQSDKAAITLTPFFIWLITDYWQVQIPLEALAPLLTMLGAVTNELRHWIERQDFFT